MYVLGFIAVYSFVSVIVTGWVCYLVCNFKKGV